MWVSLWQVKVTFWSKDSDIQGLKRLEDAVSSLLSPLSVCVIDVVLDGLLHIVLPSI